MARDAGPNRFLILGGHGSLLYNHIHLATFLRIVVIDNNQ